MPSRCPLFDGGNLGAAASSSTSCLRAAAWRHQQADSKVSQDASADDECTGNEYCLGIMC
jgi:hypothetical protein